jgi:hypothetical protein
MAMSTEGKVALGVGITLALAGVGVGLYFVFRKPKTEAQQAADIFSAQKPPITLAELQKQNPTMSNADLLKALGALLKKPQVSGGGGSGGSGGGIGGGGASKKPTGGGQASGYDYQSKDTGYNQYPEGTSYNDAAYQLSGYSSEIPSDWASYDYSGGGSGGSYGGESAYSGGSSYGGGY